MPIARSPKHRPAILATSIATWLSLGLLLSPPRAAADEYWDGTSTVGSGTANGQGGPGTWDTTNTNWVDKAGHNPHAYLPGNRAVFATTGGAVTLGSDISFTRLRFDASGYTIGAVDDAHTLTITGAGSISAQKGVSVTIHAPLAGTDGVAYRGTGTIILDNNTGNTYTGGTTIGTANVTDTTGPTVVIGKDAELGDPSGGLTFYGGTLQTTLSFASARAITLNAGGGTFAPATGTTLTLNGVVSGAGGLTANGGGTLALTAGDTYSGGTTITGGATVSIADDSALGAAGTAITFNKGTLVATTTLTTDRNMTIQGGVVNNLQTGGGVLAPVSGATLTATGMISGAGPLTAGGAGTVVLTNTNNTYSGGTAIASQATLSISSDANLGAAAGQIDFAGGTLVTTGNVTTSRQIVLEAAGGTISVPDHVTTQLNGFITEQINGFTGQAISGALTITGPGTVVLGGNNAYSGGTTINGGATVQVSQDSNLGDATNPFGQTVTLAIDNGTLSATGSFFTSRNVTIGAGNAVFSVASGKVLNLGGGIANLVPSTGTTPDGALTATGGGTLVLSSTSNSYTGKTTIEGGTTLVISGDGSLGASKTDPTTQAVTFAGVTFDNGTLQSTADITTSQPLTLNGGGGTLSPTAGNTFNLNGNITGPGALTVTGNGTVVMPNVTVPVGTPPTAPIVTYSGGTTISGGATLVITSDAAQGDGALGASTGGVTMSDGTLRTSGIISTSSSRTFTLTAAANGNGGTFSPTGLGDQLTINGNIVGNGGLTKTGLGTLSLYGANTYSGPTTVLSGNLVINTSNVGAGLNASSALVMGGGLLEYDGAAGAARNQVLDGLTVDSGTSQITVINSGTTTTLDLRGTSGTQGIVRNANGFVDFSAGVNQGLGVTSVILTHQANDATGIIGAWATVNNGAAFAANDGSDSIVAYTGYKEITALGPSTITNDPLSNVRINDLGTTGPVTLAGAGSDGLTNINTLTQNFGTASTVDTSGGGLRVGSVGGIFITPTGGALTIGTAPNSGVLTAGGGASKGAGQLILSDDSANALTINAVITDNGQGSVSLNVSSNGAGATVLTGDNTYTGGTTISKGRLQAGAVNVLPSSGAVNINKNGTLDLNNFDQTVSSIADGTGGGGTIALGTGILTVGTGNANSAFSGNISGDGSLIKTGTGALTLSGPNSYTGGTTLVSGILIANGSAFDGSGTPLGAGTLTIQGGLLTTTIQPTSPPAGTTALTGTTLANPISLDANFMIGTNVNTDNKGAQNITLNGAINLNGTTRDIVGVTNGAQVHFGTGGIGVPPSGSASETAGVNFDTIFHKSGDYVAFIMDPGNTNNYTGLTTVNSGAFLVFEGVTPDGAIHGNVDIEGNGVADYLGASDQIVNTATVTVNSFGNTLGGTHFDGFELRNFNETIATLNGFGTVALGSGTLTLNGGNFAGLIEDGAFGQGGNLIKLSTDTLLLSGAARNTGVTIVSAGTLQTGGFFVLSPFSALTVSTGATLDMHSFTQEVGSIAGGGTINLGAGLLITGNDNTNTAFTGIIQDILPSGHSPTIGGSLEKIGTGTLTLGAMNNYTGQTLVLSSFDSTGTVLQGGTLQAGVAFAIPRTSGVGVDFGSTLNLTNLDQSIGSLSDEANGGGTVILGTAAFTLGNDNTTEFFSGNITGTTATLTKVGKGLQYLGGVNSYTGLTTVAKGALELYGGGLIPGSLASQVQIQNGATFTMESGTSIATTLTPVSMAGRATFNNASTVTATGTGSVGVSLDATSGGSLVMNYQPDEFISTSPEITGEIGMKVANLKGVVSISNVGTITGTGVTGGPAIAIDASTSAGVKIATLGTIVGDVLLNPKGRNTIVYGTNQRGTVIPGTPGRHDTLELAGSGVDTFDLNTAPDFETFNKVGGGTWTVTGSASFINDATIAGGTLDLQGVLTVPNAVVQSTAMLTGAGYLNGNVTNFGVLSPGGALQSIALPSQLGTLTITGNYTQDAGGAMVIQIGGHKAGQYDLVSIGGHAQLNGKLQLEQVGDGPGLKVGQKLTFLTAGGGVSGEFSEVDNPFTTGTVVGGKIVYDPNGVALEGTQGSFQSIERNFALTTNQRAVAVALDSVATKGSASKLVSYLDDQPLKQLPGDFDRIAPEEMTSIFRLGISLGDVQTANLQRRTSDLRSGASGFSAAGFQASGASPNYSGPLAGAEGAAPGNAVASPIPDQRWGVFLTGVGDYVHLGDSENARGYGLDTGGLTLGADYKLSPHLAVGVSVGYTGTTAQLAGGGSETVNGGKLGAYGTYFTGGFYVDAAVDGGYNSYDTRRSALQGDARGSTTGGEVNGLAAVGYDWQLEALTIGPTASFQYTYVGTGGYAEHGSLAPLKYDSQGGQSARSTLGIKASYDWHVGHVIVRPEAHVAWRHEFGDRSFTIDSSLASGSDEFAVTDTAVARDSLLLGGGVAVLWSPRTSTYLYYDAELLRKEYDTQSVSGGLRLSF